MIHTRPSFIDSPFFVGEPGNWHLKPGAPKEVQKEFERFQQDLAQRDTDAPALEDIEL